MNLDDLIKKLQWYQEQGMGQSVLVVHNITQRDHDVISVDPIWEDEGDQDEATVGVIIYIE